MCFGMPSNDTHFQHLFTSVKLFTSRSVMTRTSCTKSSHKPISLCNVNYKISAKILTHSLHSITQIVVGESQSCGIRGWSIQTNAHMFRRILACVSDSADQVAMLQIHLFKASVCVIHVFIFELLSHLNIRETLFEGIRLCYKKCSSWIIISNILSDPISIRSGKVASFLLSCLRSSWNHSALAIFITTYPGYIYLSLNVKLLAYADDVAYFRSGKRSVEVAAQVTDQFCGIPGARVNDQKNKKLPTGVRTGTCNSGITAPPPLSMRVYRPDAIPSQTNFENGNWKFTTDKKSNKRHYRPWCGFSLTTCTISG